MKLFVPVSESVWSALGDWAKLEMRDRQNQAAHYLIAGMRMYGHLPKDAPESNVRTLSAVSEGKIFQVEIENAKTGFTFSRWTLTRTPRTGDLLTIFEAETGDGGVLLSGEVVKVEWLMMNDDKGFSVHVLVMPDKDYPEPKTEPKG